MGILVGPYHHPHKERDKMTATDTARDTAWATYEAATAPAQATYEAARTSAWATYEAARYSTQPR